MYRHSPGFGMPDTEILFPLTQNAVLLGSFEGDEGTVVASAPFQAAVNSKMIALAFEQVYAPKKAFPYVGPNLQFHHDRHFMERYAPFKKQAKAEQ